MSFTNYTEAGVLAYVLGAQPAAPGDATPFVPPAGACYVALFTVGPDETGDTNATEVTAGANGYVRTPALMQVTSVGDPTQATNIAAVAFQTAVSAWGTITHVGIYDQAAAGQLIAFAALQTPATVNTGDQFQIQTGNLRVTLE